MAGAFPGHCFLILYHTFFRFIGTLALLQMLRYIFMPIWKIWFGICFSVPFLVMFPLFYFALRGRHYDFVFRLKRFWSGIISYGSLLFPEIRYSKQKYRLPKPCVVVSNHTSYLDIVFSPFYIDHTAVYMGKYELLKLPLFKYFFVYLDIPVNRRSLTDAHRAFTVAGQKIDQGLSQVIYPEGTISSNGVLRPFKNGAFKLAVEKQVPIIPVVNLNNFCYLQNGGFFKSFGRPGRPQIIVGEPISTVGLNERDVPVLKQKVYTFISLELEKFNGERN
jgi:1-acyl-sn-glycerol-3-phosphate acyltransferase